MNKRIVLFFLTSFIILFVLAVGQTIFHYESTYNVDTLSNGWAVTYHNDNYVNVMPEHLDNYLGRNLTKGDIVVLSHSLKKDYASIPLLTMIFKTSFSAYEVFLDDDLIQSEGVDTYYSDGYIGNGYKMIMLGDVSHHHKLTIVLHISEEGVSAITMAPTIGNYEDILHLQISRSIFPFLTGIFLIVFGVSFLAISIIFSPFSKEALPQAPVSFLTMLTGLWTLCAYDLSSLIINSKYTTTLEYLSLYLIIPTTYLIVAMIHKNSVSKAYIIIACGFTALSLLFIALHFLNVVHINHFLDLYDFIAVISFLILLYIYIRDFTNKVAIHSSRILMTGIVILCFSMLIYGIYLFFVDVADFSNIPFLQNAFPIGAIIFVLMQLFNYFVIMTHSMAKRKEYLSLTQLAYYDSLTGLSNRARCDMELANIDKTEDDYCIVSLDMNGLKEVNDNAGHPEGDKFLKSFSSVLKQVYGEVTDAMCFRVGGDEFLVLLPHPSKEVVDLSIAKVHSNLLILDDLEPEYSHSTAIGYAFRHETVSRKSHAVYMLADARMYEQKRRQHETINRLKKGL